MGPVDLTLNIPLMMIQLKGNSYLFSTQIVANLSLSLSNFCRISCFSLSVLFQFSAMCSVYWLFCLCHAHKTATNSFERVVAMFNPSYCDVTWRLGLLFYMKMGLNLSLVYHFCSADLSNRHLENICGHFYSHRFWGWDLWDPLVFLLKLELTFDLLFQCFGILKTSEDTNMYFAPLPYCL